MRTQSFTPYSFGNRFFEFYYINIIPDSFSLSSSCRNVTPDPLILLCRNVRLRSPNTTCRNRTLRSPNTTCQNVTLRSPKTIYSNVTLQSTNLITLFHQVFSMPRRHLNKEDTRLKIQHCQHSNPPQSHN